MTQFMQKVIKVIDDKNKVNSILLSQNNIKQMVNEKDEHGDTLLHFASRIHNIPVMSLLISMGANIEVINEKGRRPLHEAIDSLECVQYLIEHCQVNVNAMKKGDWTPVMIAAMKGNIDIVKLLVNSGALLNRKTKDGRTALYLSVQEGHVELSKYLVDQYPEAITQATKSGRYPTQAAAAFLGSKGSSFTMTTYLLSHSLTPLPILLSYRDNSGRNILLDSAVAQNIDLLKFLLDQGADASDSDSLGRNMIHHASMMGHVNVLKVLEEIKGLDWNKQDSWDNWTPLMHASKEGHLDVVIYLTKTINVNIYITDKHNRTAKKLAEIWNRKSIFEYL